MSSILITGTSRGIGLELVRRFLSHENPPKLLIATCRKPETVSELQNLAKTHSNLVILKLDVDDIDNYPTFVNEVTSIVGDGGLNVLINNAGIAVAKTMEEVTWRDYQTLYHTNCIAPVFLTLALLPLIRKAAQLNDQLPMGISRAAVLNVSSRQGSVTLNFGGYWAYRESKTALNQATRNLALEVGKEGILVCRLHPGWVKTNLGGPGAAIDVDQSVSGLISVIYNLKEADQDGYIDYEGKTIPW